MVRRLASRRIFEGSELVCKNAQARHWALIFTDEASFRQDSTLHATWSRVGYPPEVPVTGERKSVKILGAIELWRTRFEYRQDTVFNAPPISASSNNWPDDIAARGQS